MTLDTRLRDTLTTRGATVTPPPAPLDTLTSGVRRRRANRVRVVGAASAAVAIAVAVPMLRPAPRPDEPASGKPVAWLDYPVALGDEPRILAQSYIARECTATDLAVTVLHEGDNYVVQARNAGTENCTLISRPTLESRISTVVAVPTSEWPESADYARAAFVPLAPGEGGHAWVEVPHNCAAPRTVRYDAVFVTVDGASAPLAGLLGAACGLAVTKFMRDGSTPEVRTPQGDVAVSGVAAPAVVQAGSTFTFRVSLIGNTAGAFRGDCPIYAMSLGAVTKSYRLNCQGVSIPGGERRWFDMSLAVPAGTPPGTYPLVWWFRNQTDPTPNSVLGTVTVE